MILREIIPDDDLFPGFQLLDVQTKAARIRVRTGGKGPPLLLLHGYPQTHVLWHKIAPLLQDQFTLVMPDLRGYGDSEKPDTAVDHATYSKRASAQDMIDVMATLGHTRFCIGSHDRGARVAHRLAVDHPEQVSKLAVLDVAPTREMYRRTTDAFARAYWHWFFLIQPAPIPERMIGSDPDAYWIAKCGSGPAGLASFDPRALRHYLRCFRDPECIRATCEDYRAAATIDIRHDDDDGDAGITCPLLVLWGAFGVIEACFDALALWRQRAGDVRGHSLPGGHYLAEDVPDLVASEFLTFFRDAS
jgi:haloacetate dehalogenase